MKTLFDRGTLATRGKPSRNERKLTRLVRNSKERSIEPPVEDYGLSPYSGGKTSRGNTVKGTDRGCGREPEASRNELGDLAAPFRRYPNRHSLGRKKMAHSCISLEDPLWKNCNGA